MRLLDNDMKSNGSSQRSDEPLNKLAKISREGNQKKKMKKCFERQSD